MHFFVTVFHPYSINCMGNFECVAAGWWWLGARWCAVLVATLTRQCWQWVVCCTTWPLPLAPQPDTGLGSSDKCLPPAGSLLPCAPTKCRLYYNSLSASRLAHHKRSS